MDPQENAMKEGEYKWKCWSVRERFRPNRVLRVGTDSDGRAIYLGRVEHKGHNLVVKVVPGAECVFPLYGMEKLEKSDVSLLVDDGKFFWEFYKQGDPPETAVRIASNSQSAVLYVGRVIHVDGDCQWSETPGASSLAKRVLRINVGDWEAEFPAYQMLCHKEDNCGRAGRFLDAMIAFLNCISTRKCRVPE